MSRELASFRDDVGRDLDSQENVLVQVRGEVGRRSNHMGMSTLWGHVESLSEDTEKLSESMAPSAMEAQVQPVVDRALAQVVMREILPIVKPSFMFAKRFTTGADAPTGDALESRLAALEGGLKPSTMGSAGGSMFGELGAHHPTFHGAPQASAVPSAGPVQAQLDAIMLRFAAQDAEIAALKETIIVQDNHLAMMRSAMASEVCEIGGESFDSELSARSFATANRMGEMPTCAIDAISLLQVAHSCDFADTASGVEATANAVKAGYTDLLQSTVATSYKIHIPSVLGGKAKAGVANPLPAFKTYELWDDKSTISERSSTEASLKQSTASLKAVIADSTLTGKAKELAKNMVDHAAIVVVKLFMFMDRFYGELCNTYGTGKTEAWHLVSSVVKRFFSDVYAVRGRAKFISMQAAKTDSISGAYLWASLQAHRIMEAYVESDFRHHPSVAPVITIHLYSHRVPDSIYQARAVKVDELLKSMAESVKTANTTAGQALKKASG